VIPQAPWPDGLIASVLLVYLLLCALPSYIVHELYGWRWWWDR
jgi:hypothetical protein